MFTHVVFSRFSKLFSCQLAEEADDSPLQVELLNKMAGFYSRLGEVHRTIACLNRLLELHDVTGDTEAELHVMGSLAGIS